MRALKLTIFAGIAVVALTAALFWFWQSRNKEPGEVVLVEKGTLYQEVFATGKVKPAEELNLSFQTGGLISAIHVKENDVVQRGQVLADLDKSELQSRLREAEANLSGQESSLRTWQVQLQNAKDALFTRTTDSYNKIEEAFFTNAEPLFAGGTFGLSIQEGATTHSFNTPDIDLKISLNDQRKELLNLIPSWRQSLSRDNLLSEAKLVRERLEDLRDFIDDLAQAVSHFSTDKTTIATILNSHRSAVAGAQSSISLAIVNLDAATQNLMSEESKVSEAGVEQAKRQIETLRIQLRQTSLLAPFSGTTLKKLARAGEVVQQGQVVFTFYPEDPFSVEAEIYEGDIGTITLGQTAQLEFIAFPDMFFEGEVVEINPAPVLINGVVHYLATLRIIDPPANILLGMSVDVKFPLE